MSTNYTNKPSWLPKPLHDYLLIQRNPNEYKGQLVIPEKHQMHVTSNAKVLARGKDVLPEILPGDIVLHLKTAEGHELWTHPENKTVEIIHQTAIFGILRANAIIPIGNVVMIRRFIDEQMQGGILLPEMSQTQNLFGEVAAFGIPFKPFRFVNDLRQGNIVKLEKWHETHQEVAFGSGYYLIVKEEYIECTVDKYTPDLCG